jgi:hypothetical protein
MHTWQVDPDKAGNTPSLIGTLAPADGSVRRSTRQLETLSRTRARHAHSPASCESSVFYGVSSA